MHFNKWLIILVCCCLLFMSVYGMSYIESYGQLERVLNRVETALDTVSGLFGVLSDRTEQLIGLQPYILGAYEAGSVNVDVATFIIDNYLPSWLKDIDNEYIVNQYVYPKLYNVSLYRGTVLPFNGIQLNFMSGKMIFYTENAIRLKIVIQGNGYKSEHNIFVVVGDYHRVGSSDASYGLYYVSYDIALCNYTFASYYNSFEDFLNDNNDVTSIVPVYDDINYPGNGVIFKETDINVKDGFKPFYDFTEGVN